MRTQPKNRLFSTFHLRGRLHGPSLRGLLAVGLLLMWGVLGVGTLSAQDHSDPPTLIKHLRTELNSKDPMRRDLALVDVTTLGRCTATCSVQLASVQRKQVDIANETDIGTVIDLEVLTPDLIRVYQRGPTDGHRLLALAALINIGDQAALNKLAREISSRSPDVQRRTNRAMVAYYLEKYPELRDETERTKILKLEDVDRAERARLRLARIAADEGQN